MPPNMTIPSHTEPIPASFYNADYFNGITSNYTNGYTWEQFGELFTMTARLLIWLFPEATRFLDFGCATGLLVRALREAGKNAWGVEHSPYCLEHAEAEAKPYLVPTIGALPQVGTFDVVTAFETLEHLTEAQITEVLGHLWGRTRQVMVATIPCEDMVHRGAWELAKQEPTHISLYPIAWWHGQFEAAGFEHGLWQRLVERYVQQHPLVQNMGWQVFIMGV